MTIKVFVLALLLPFGAFPQTADHFSAKNIDDVYFVGEFPAGEGAPRALLPSIGERRKAVGRLVVSSEGVAFFARIIEKYKRFALSYDFPSGKNIKSSFGEGDKLLAIEQNGRVFFFFREDGFDESLKNEVYRVWPEK